MGIGIFTSVSYTTRQAKKRKLGKLAYYLEAVIKDKGRRGVELDIPCERGGKSKYGIVLIIHGLYGGGLKIRQKLYHNADHFYLIAIKRNKGPLGFIGMILSMARALTLKLENIDPNKYKNTVVCKMSDVFIKSEFGDAQWNCDGEKGVNGDLTINMKADQYEMILP